MKEKGRVMKRDFRLTEILQDEQTEIYNTYPALYPVLYCVKIWTKQILKHQSHLFIPSFYQVKPNSFIIFLEIIRLVPLTHL